MMAVNIVAILCKILMKQVHKRIFSLAAVAPSSAILCLLSECFSHSTENTRRGQI